MELAYLSNNLIYSRDNRPSFVPELLCSDIEKSKSFYIGTLGFAVLYERPEDNFVYLRLDGVDLMLEEHSDGDDGGVSWITGMLTPPYGRGINFQIEVGNLNSVLDRLALDDWHLFHQVEERWYRVNDTETGNRQFLVQDPDGYLLRFFEDLGTRKVVA